MKKLYLWVIAVSILASCATTGNSGAGLSSDESIAWSATDGLSLDEAIEQSVVEVVEELTAGTRIAIVAFSSEHDSLSNYILDELTGAFVDRKLEVVDRRNLAYVYRELNFQMSGEVSDETAVSIGKFLGARYVKRAIYKSRRPLPVSSFRY